MTYAYKGWVLYAKEVKPLLGNPERVYFFAKKKPKEGVPSDVPNDYDVKVDPKLLLPVLIRRRASKPLSYQTASTYVEEAEHAFQEFEASER